MTNTNLARFRQEAFEWLAKSPEKMHAFVNDFLGKGLPDALIAELEPRWAQAVAIGVVPECDQVDSEVSYLDEQHGYYVYISFCIKDGKPWTFSKCFVTEEARLEFCAKTLNLSEQTISLLTHGEQVLPKVLVLTIVDHLTPVSTSLQMHVEV